MSNTQLFFTDTPNIDDRIHFLKIKIDNLRCGLFKRYEEAKKTVDFLEQELEACIDEMRTLKLDNN
jgi:hypothetical protein